MLASFWGPARLVLRGAVALSRPQKPRGVARRHFTKATKVCRRKPGALRGQVGPKARGKNIQRGYWKCSKSVGLFRNIYKKIHINYLCSSIKKNLNLSLLVLLLNRSVSECVDHKDLGKQVGAEMLRGEKFLATALPRLPQSLKGRGHPRPDRIPERMRGLWARPTTA